MNPIRRITALMLSLILTVSFCACGKGSTSDETTAASAKGSVTTVSTEEPKVTTAITAGTTATSVIPQTTPVPETTQAPVTTTAPETTSVSVTTTALETTKVPETTKAPETTKVPETTKAPETTKTPETTVPFVTTTPEGGETPPPQDTREVLHYDDFKAMWLSQFDLKGIYTSDGGQREESDFTQRIGRVLDNVQQAGFNTVILQVRPNADSMYPSRYYPMSKYVVGQYGVDAAYDPVAILVEEAHLRGLSIHAWINPLRAMSTAEILRVSEEYPIRKWYDDPVRNGTYLVEYNGTYYLNPAYEEVRELIINGASEILQTYAFDGLHMDDYFYPTTASTFDAAAYSDYQAAGGTLSLADFRRDVLNRLVAGLYAATKAESSALRYGISPGGNYVAVYDTQYADFYTWCAEEGYIDYLCPQLYFGMEHGTYPFARVCDFFNGIIKTDSVDLYVGMTLGKANDGIDQWAGSGKNEWTDHKDVLQRCLAYTADLTRCKGVAIFCYQYFYDPVTEAPITATQEERDNFVPLLKEITWKE